MYIRVLWLRKVSTHKTMQVLFYGKKAKTKGMVPFYRHRQKLQVKPAFKLPSLAFLLCKHITRDVSAAVALVFAQQDGAAGKQDLWVLFTLMWQNYITGNRTGLQLWLPLENAEWDQWLCQPAPGSLSRAPANWDFYMYNTDCQIMLFCISKAIYNAGS